jgi:hypothetical protein
MNRTFTKILVIALLIVTSFSACTKGLNEPLSITKDNLVATYTIVSMTASEPSLGQKDVTNDNYAPCEKDDQVVLRSDYTAAFIDAGSPCSFASSGAGTWGLYGNILTIDRDDYIITKLTRSTLVLEQTKNISGLIITVTFTYRRY